jgi:hypothetical protein
MTRPSKARRRFHTDRIVANRRRRLRRETSYWAPAQYRTSYGRLATMDPWDCGNPRCGICHPREYGRRAREQRQWRADWEF